MCKKVERSHQGTSSSTAFDVHSFTWTRYRIELILKPRERSRIYLLRLSLELTDASVTFLLLLILSPDSCYFQESTRV